MRLLQDQINRLKLAASYLEQIDQKLDYLQAKNPPLIEKQKDVLRKQIRELADKYIEVEKRIIADQQEPERKEAGRFDTVTIAEDYPWHPNETV